MKRSQREWLLAGTFIGFALFGGLLYAIVVTFIIAAITD